MDEEAGGPSEKGRTTEVGDGIEGNGACTDVELSGVWVGIGGLGLVSVLVYDYVSAFERRYSFLVGFGTDVRFLLPLSWGHPRW